MGLLRTVMSLLVLLILAHVALVYLGIEASANVVTQSIYSLGILVESPATLVLGLVGNNLPAVLDPGSFFVVAFTAIAIYFVLYVLLGVGSRG